MPGSLWVRSLLSRQPAGPHRRRNANIVRHPAPRCPASAFQAIPREKVCTGGSRRDEAGEPAMEVYANRRGNGVRMGKIPTSPHCAEECCHTRASRAIQHSGFTAQKKPGAKTGLGNHLLTLTWHRRSGAALPDCARCIRPGAAALSLCRVPAVRFFASGRRRSM